MRKPPPWPPPSYQNTPPSSSSSTQAPSVDKTKTTASSSLSDATKHSLTFSTTCTASTTTSLNAISRFLTSVTTQVDHPPASTAPASTGATTATTNNKPPFLSVDEPSRAHSFSISSPLPSEPSTTTAASSSTAVNTLSRFLTSALPIRTSTHTQPQYRYPLPFPITNHLNKPKIQPQAPLERSTITQTIPLELSLPTVLSPSPDQPPSYFRSALLSLEAFLLFLHALKAGFGTVPWPWPPLCSNQHKTNQHRTKADNLRLVGRLQELIAASQPQVPPAAGTVPALKQTFTLAQPLEEQDEGITARPPASSSSSVAVVGEDEVCLPQFDTGYLKTAIGKYRLNALVVDLYLTLPYMT